MRVRTYRKIHRWLGIVIGIQLLLWTGSGLFFALNPIDRVRGETEQTAPESLAEEMTIASPDEAFNELRSAHGDIGITSVLLRLHLDTAVYEISFVKDGETMWALADAATGRIRGPIDRDETIAIATADFTAPAKVAAVEHLTETAADSEYRGRPLPAYRVDFDHPLGTRIYVSADRGAVTARRNDRWRLFDFLWMFHIMDYQDREDFNSVILQAASALGLITILSGFVLAGMTSPRLRRLFGGRRGD